LIAAEPALKATPAQKVSEGVTVKGNTATLKPGYTFKKVSKSGAELSYRNNTTGSFNCFCSGQGACEVAIEGGTLSCRAGNSCSGGCRLDVVIKPPVTQ